MGPSPLFTSSWVTLLHRLAGLYEASSIATKLRRKKEQALQPVIDEEKRGPKARVLMQRVF